MPSDPKCVGLLDQPLPGARCRWRGIQPDRIQFAVETTGGLLSDCCSLAAVAGSCCSFVVRAEVDSFCLEMRSSDGVVSVHSGGSQAPYAALHTHRPLGRRRLTVHTQPTVFEVRKKPPCPSIWRHLARWAKEPSTSTTACPMRWTATPDTWSHCHVDWSAGCGGDPCVGGHRARYSSGQHGVTRLCVQTSARPGHDRH